MHTNKFGFKTKIILNPENDQKQKQKICNVLLTIDDIVKYKDESDINDDEKISVENIKQGDGKTHLVISCPKVLDESDDEVNYRLEFAFEKLSSQSNEGFTVEYDNHTYKSVEFYGKDGKTILDQKKKWNTQKASSYLEIEGISLNALLESEKLIKNIADIQKLATPGQQAEEPFFLFAGREEPNIPKNANEILMQIIEAARKIKNSNDLIKESDPINSTDGTQDDAMEFSPY